MKHCETLCGACGVRVLHRLGGYGKPALPPLSAAMGSALRLTTDHAGAEEEEVPSIKERALMPIFALHDLMLLATALGGSALVTAVMHAYMPTLRRNAEHAGEFTAHAAVKLISELPANAFFRAAIAMELRALASQATDIDVTVSNAASAVLAKVAPTFPTATRNDVVEVLGDFTHAFAAGLAATDVTGAPTLADSAAPVTVPQT